MGKPFTLDKRIIQRYASKGLILDTKLFILFLAGIYNPNSIGKNKLTKEFSIEDWELIQIFLKASNNKILVTPHILTESSNFLERDLKGEFQIWFKKISKELMKMKEFLIEKNKILSIPETQRFGITDIGTIITRKICGGLIITSDSNLVREYSKKGVPILNFNHLRNIYWAKKKGILS
ncbi:hypothetical protein KAJ87_01265 [Candidatus Pacearchaeota archaeon]|nr:hypothetical protein [Candidatus Pacearchaeota archaeon]